MKKKSIYITLIIILGFFSWIFFNDKINNTCFQILEKNISWNSMEPSISSWEKMKLFVWYYDCNEIKRGDLIAYDFANSGELFIKKLYVLPWDKLEIQDSQLLINWELMINSTGNIYKFNDADIKLMSLYIVNWKLKQWSYFVFWDNIWNSTDSRKFWAIWKKDIIWKFE